ncbi:MAG: hypothetical protein ONB32_03080 [candidate division KSB1 bacterium]|nr:hypothetical protein [candidate division KSB1 bacterium]MDZ7401384.1 hypothetical protein [candidate division KSB1 bacterium]
MTRLLAQFCLTMKFISIVLILLIGWPMGTVRSQDELSPSQRIIADSVVTAADKKDSLIQRALFRVKTEYQAQPMHPYFRDRYRVIHDLRRLVRMFNYTEVEGYESVEKLVEICRHLPAQQQNKLIAMAMAGGAVNLVAERTNRELRKRKIDLLQWQVDKVTFRNRFKFISVSLHGGINSRGFVVSIPAARIYLYRYFAEYYITEGVIAMPTRHLGINCHRYDGRSFIAPFYVTKLGSYEWSYDWKRKILTSRVDLRKTSRLVVRLVHVNFLDHRYPDRFLGELIIWP